MSLGTRRHIVASGRTSVVVDPPPNWYYKPLYTMGMARLILLAVGVSVIYGQAPTVSVLPDVLWGPGDNVTRNVVETAVIQLYCSGSGATILDITWTKNGTTLTNDPPHLRIRASSTDTSVLTVDNFGSSDDGEYACLVSSSTGSASSGTLTLTALGSAPSRLTFNRQPNSREGNPDNAATTGDALMDNRTAITQAITEVDPNGTAAGNLLLRCDCGHEDGNGGFPAPSVVWVRDGVQLVHDGTEINIDTFPDATNERTVSDLEILNFDDSDGGVIQCIYTDSDGDAEVFPSIPHRLDRGETLVLRRITPPGLVVLDPPEKLVLEVESSGAYARLGWSRNNVGFSFAADADFPATPDRFINFYEIYVHDPTNTSDLGVYEVDVVTANFGQNILQAGDFQFVVIPYVLPFTTSNQAAVVINEGDSINISCTSVGIPTPSIVWRIRGSPSRFNQTDTSQPEPEGSLNGDNVFSSTKGSTTSILHIIDAVYPDDDGVYECIGVNSHGGVNRNTSNTANVEVQYPPEVTIEPLENPVVLGSSVQLMCSATGSPPITYEWVQVGKEGAVLNTDTSTGDFSLLITEVSQYGTYMCIARNNAGMDSASVVVVEAVPPATSENQEVSFFVGEPLILSVNITTFNLPLTTLAWTLDGTLLQTTERITIAHSSVTEPPASSRLTVDPVQSANDGGTYNFTAVNPAGQSVTTFTVIIYATTTSLFQLRLLFINSDCVDWEMDNSNQKATDIISSVVSTVTMECSCGFKADDIINNNFSCSSSTQSVVFRAEISYTSLASDYTANDFVGFISDWAQSGPLITVDGDILSIDASCPTQLESFGSDDCKTAEEDENGFDITEYLLIIIVGGAGIIVLVLFVITLVLVGVLVCLRRRRKRKFWLKAEAAAELAQYPTNPAYGKRLPEVEDHLHYSSIGTDVAYFKEYKQDKLDSVSENTYDEPLF